MKGGKSLGDAINLTYDPSVCQSPQDCANQTIATGETQNNAVSMLDGARGGGKKRRLSKQKGGSLGGLLDEKPPPPGMVEVRPLPQGSSTNSTQENNMIMNKEFDKIWIHGYLHLLGYDHKKINDLKIMNKKESNLLKYLAK